MKKDKTYLGIRDIARLAGVSIATVSRVLNDPKTTTEKSRKKVMDIVERYNYVPNIAAKNLYSGHSNSIALFVYDMTNPFYTQFIKYFNNIAMDNGYTVIIYDAEDSEEREKKFLEFCRGIRVAGIVYTAGSTRELIGGGGEAFDFPIVVIDRKGFGDKASYSVRANYYKGLSLLVGHIASLNHKEIGFITGPISIFSARERLNGFIDAMAERGLSIREEWIYRGNYKISGGLEAYDYFASLKDQPTAVIASNDRLAQGFILRANECGRRIPEDISICGFDGFLTDFYPPITTVKQDLKLIAEAAFSKLIGRDEGMPPEELVTDVTLQIGKTTRAI
ncbi:LacI family DNA-binding transcriptional regulator [Agathobaculum sp. TL06]